MVKVTHWSNDFSGKRKMKKEGKKERKNKENKRIKFSLFDTVESSYFDDEKMVKVCLADMGSISREDVTACNGMKDEDALWLRWRERLSLENGKRRVTQMSLSSLLLLVLREIPPSSFLDLFLRWACFVVKQEQVRLTNCQTQLHQWQLHSQLSKVSQSNDHRILLNCKIELKSPTLQLFTCRITCRIRVSVSQVTCCYCCAKNNH